MYCISFRIPSCADDVKIGVSVGIGSFNDIYLREKEKETEENKKVKGSREERKEGL